MIPDDKKEAVIAILLKLHQASREGKFTQGGSFVEEAVYGALGTIQSEKAFSFLLEQAKQVFSKANETLYIKPTFQASLKQFKPGQINLFVFSSLIQALAKYKKPEMLGYIRTIAAWVQKSGFAKQIEGGSYLEERILSCLVANKGQEAAQILIDMLKTNATEERILNPFVLTSYSRTIFEFTEGKPGFIDTRKLLLLLDEMAKAHSAKPTSTNLKPVTADSESRSGIGLDEIKQRRYLTICFAQYLKGLLSSQAYYFRQSELSDLALALQVIGASDAGTPLLEYIEDLKLNIFNSNKAIVESSYAIASIASPLLHGKLLTEVLTTALKIPQYLLNLGIPIEFAYAAASLGGVTVINTFVDLLNDNDQRKNTVGLHGLAFMLQEEKAPDFSRAS